MNKVLRITNEKSIKIFNCFKILSLFYINIGMVLYLRLYLVCFLLNLLKDLLLVKFLDKKNKISQGVKRGIMEMADLILINNIFHESKLLSQTSSKFRFQFPLNFSHYLFNLLIYQSFVFILKQETHCI